MKTDRGTHCDLFVLDLSAEQVKKLLGGQGFDTARGGCLAAMADPEGNAAKNRKAQGEN